MGTEIVVLFIPVPLLFWGWGLWRLRERAARPKALALLALGVLFMAFFCLPAPSTRYFLQGWAIGSFLYIPFYLACWLAVTLLLKLAAQPNDEQTTKSN